MPEASVEGHCAQGANELLLGRFLGIHEWAYQLLAFFGKIFRGNVRDASGK